MTQISRALIAAWFYVLFDGLGIVYVVWAGLPVGYVIALAVSLMAGVPVLAILYSQRRRGYNPPPPRRRPPDRSSRWFARHPVLVSVMGLPVVAFWVFVGVKGSRSWWMPVLLGFLAAAWWVGLYVIGHRRQVHKWDRTHPPGAE